MDQVRKKLRAEYAHRKGITGRGVTVAVMDTGIVMHPDFGKRILNFADLPRGDLKYMMITGMVLTFPGLLEETAE